MKPRRRYNPAGLRASCPASATTNVLPKLLDAFPHRSVQVKRLFALVVLLFVPSAARAQTLGSIIGRVIDARSEAPLQGAAITVVGTNLRALSGTDGRFIIGSVPPGERT